VNGGETRKIGEAGKCAGQPYQKLHLFVGNSYIVAARKAAEDVASARRLLCNAPNFVSVADFALKNHVSPSIF